LQTNISRACCDKAPFPVCELGSLSGARILTRFVIRSTIPCVKARALCCNHLARLFVPDSLAKVFNTCDTGLRRVPFAELIPEPEVAQSGPQDRSGPLPAPLSTTSSDRDADRTAESVVRISASLSARDEDVVMTEAPPASLMGELSAEEPADSTPSNPSFLLLAVKSDGLAAICARLPEVLAQSWTLSFLKPDEHYERTTQASQLFACSVVQADRIVHNGLELIKQFLWTMCVAFEETLEWTPPTARRLAALCLDGLLRAIVPPAMAPTPSPAVFEQWQTQATRWLGSLAALGTFRRIKQLVPLSTVSSILRYEVLHSDTLLSPSTSFDPLAHLTADGDSSFIADLKRLGSQHIVLRLHAQTAFVTSVRATVPEAATKQAKGPQVGSKKGKEVAARAPKRKRGEEDGAEDDVDLQPAKEAVRVSASFMQLRVDLYGGRELPSGPRCASVANHESLWPTKTIQLRRGQIPSARALTRVEQAMAAEDKPPDKVGTLKAKSAPRPKSALKAKSAPRPKPALKAKEPVVPAVEAVEDVPCPAVSLKAPASFEPTDMELKCGLSEDPLLVGCDTLDCDWYEAGQAFVLPTQPSPQVPLGLHSLWQHARSCKHHLYVRASCDFSMHDRSKPSGSALDAWRPDRLPKYEPSGLPPFPFYFCAPCQPPSSS
jgi:hypothetical protein